MQATRRKNLTRCIVADCDALARCAEMCSAHYERKRRGRPLDDTPVTRWRPQAVRDEEKAKLRGMCREFGCRADSVSMHLCGEHLEQHMPRLIEEKFLKHVDAGGEDECWPWTGSLTSKGYGRLRIGRNGRTLRPHRYALERLVGPVPEGKMVDHLCHNPPCCNPKHLRVATPSENALNIEGLCVDNTSGYRGVETNVAKHGSIRYAARVALRGRRFYLGSYSSAQEAHEAVVRFHERNSVLWDSVNHPSLT